MVYNFGRVTILFVNIFNMLPVNKILNILKPFLHAAHCPPSPPATEQPHTRQTVQKFSTLSSVFQAFRSAMSSGAGEDG